MPVVYDGVGKDTWETSLDCIEPRGLMVSFGNASGPVAGVSLATLNQKGSLYVTRPSLGVHVNTLEKLQAASEELFDLVLKKKIKVRIDQRYPLAQAGGAQTALARADHRRHGADAGLSGARRGAPRNRLRTARPERAAASRRVFATNAA